MAEFVNWDRAEQGASGPSSPIPGSGPCPGLNLDFQPVQENHDFDLALANIDGDDFSFWALEHFETSNLNPLAQSNAANGSAALNSADAGGAACDACDASGFTCQRIDEGSNKGSCTTCATLKITCSFTLPSGLNGLASENSASGRALRQGDDLDMSSPEAAGLTTSNMNGTPPAPKVGARFSRDAVRILKAWLSTHTHRPYPNDEERESLQKQTGLNKTQITNWLANARRRSKGKFHQTRSTSPSVRGWSAAIEIPRRNNSGSESELLSPLQRWENSPPEHEPACVTAIASAVLHFNPHDSGLNSPFNATDDDAARSCNESSASSFGTSPSAASFGSALSHGSRGSFNSLHQRGRRRRRRRTAPKESGDNGGQSAPPKTFQCTFCTETFRTKHDWQRHEKSLHLSLERWICCPAGPTAPPPGKSQPCCVFCEKAEPDSAHVEGHNHSLCQERSLSERTFYRKDHLRQHLKLVHNAKYIQHFMDSWKVPTPDIRSRCGFCGSLLSSWPERVDHLAEHFKSGSDMSSWKGDWGFEPAVLSMVENAIPPYVIHDERISPMPFRVGGDCIDSPRNAYELLKLELSFYIERVREATGTAPSDEDIQHDACRIIYAAEVSSKTGLAAQGTWLRDLIMSSAELNARAQMGPLRGKTEGYLNRPCLVGKDNVFEDCSLEKQLAEFARARMLLGSTLTDQELQVEAGNIIGRADESSTKSSENVADFFMRLIHKDTAWLTGFRQRAGLPPAVPSHARGQSSMTSMLPQYPQLEQQQNEVVRENREMNGVDPSEDALKNFTQHDAYGDQANSQTTPADSSEWLHSFESRHLQNSNSTSPFSATNSPSHIQEGNAMGPFSSSSNLMNQSLHTSLFAPTNPIRPQFSTPADLVSNSHHFSSGSSCYRRIERELRRFVASTMSPNNPNRHVPTDEELQHQARWILYDDDDPLNRTLADNQEWLLRFKLSVGIISAADSELLPGASWNSNSGGHVNGPASLPTPPDISGSEPMQIDGRPSSSIMPGGPRTPENGLVFADREFEQKLTQFAVSEVASSGRMPADRAIQARAKELSGLEVWQAQPTPADDPMLLSKFKLMVVDRVRAVLGAQGGGPTMDQHVPAASSALAHSRHTPDKGMDAIDPGLLPALDRTGERQRDSDAANGSVDTAVKIAITEERLDEIINDALGR